jgi:regulator of CtrA degradation
MSSNLPSESDTEFLAAFAGGKVFERVFTEGMALVEETASYLDGPGRSIAKELPREARLTYTSWSMELTTRLMQAASWLVMQRAVHAARGCVRPEVQAQS